MLISKFTPAETLLIRDGSQASAKDLLKCTFMDLLRKQVLTIQEVPRQPDNRDTATTQKYVSTGANFQGYAAFAHELPFVSAFHRNTRLLFRNCVEIAYENTGSEKKLHRIILSTPALHEAFSRSWFQKLFGGFSHTDEGLSYQNTVRDELAELERELPVLLKSDKEKALERIRLIGGNVFLVPDLNLSLLQEFDEAFPKETASAYSDGGCGSWESTSHHSDGSCWGDSSGDSGCSGDGGCGGCGGD